MGMDCCDIKYMGSISILFDCLGHFISKYSILKVAVHFPGIKVRITVKEKFLFDYYLFNVAI
jgi:hypothetical protein